VVAVEACRIADTRTNQQSDTPAAAPAAARQRVVSLTHRRLADPAAVIAGLPPDRRPLPTVTAYDEMLTRRAAATSPAPSTSSGSQPRSEVS
jgi:hypothetical protein